MKYVVTIKDYNNHDIQVKVSEEVYELYEDERREKERQRNRNRRHGIARELDDYLLINQSGIFYRTLEDHYLLKEKLRIIENLLKTCTPIQRERFYLNRICGYSYAQISRIQDCGTERVCKSVEIVMKKIKKLLDEGGEMSYK